MAQQFNAKKRVYHDAEGKRVELKSVPPDAEIWYTTDGSKPRSHGISYKEPFLVTKSTRPVLAIAQKAHVWSDELPIEIDWGTQEKEIDLEKPAQWQHLHKFATTEETYNFLASLKKNEGRTESLRITVGSEDKYVDLNVAKAIHLDGEQIEQIIEALRSIWNEGQIKLAAQSLRFDIGQNLVDFASDEKVEIKKMEEVKQ